MGGFEINDAMISMPGGFTDLRLSGNRYPPSIEAKTLGLVINLIVDINVSVIIILF